MKHEEITRKEYFTQKITNYLAELNKLNINAQAETFNQHDYDEFLVEWDDILQSLDNCSKELAKENLNNK